MLPSCRELSDLLLSSTVQEAHSLRAGQEIFGGTKSKGSLPCLSVPKSLTGN